MDELSMVGFIGKTALSLDGGKVAGLICDLVVNQRTGKCKFFVCESGAEKCYAKISDIYSVGTDAVIFRYTESFSFEAESIGLLGKPVYNADGEFLGSCSDILTDESYSVQSLKCSLGGSVPFEKIVRAGEEAVLTEGKNFRPVVRNKKRKENVTDERESTEENLEEKKVDKLPSSIVANNKLLLGRKVKKRVVYDRTGLIIAEKNTLITAAVLERAKKYGKLFELTVNSIGHIIAD